MLIFEEPFEKDKKVIFPTSTLAFRNWIYMMRSKVSEDSLDRARSCISSLDATANMIRIFTLSQVLSIFVKKTMMPMWQWQRWFRLIPKGESPTGT